MTYNANGGSVSTISKTGTYNSTWGTLSTPTRANYNFLGWYTAASGGSQVTASTVVSGNITVYAHWEQTSFLTSGNMPSGAAWATYQSGVSGNQQEQTSASYNGTSVVVSAGGLYGQSTWRALIGYIDGLPIVGKGQTIKVNASCKIECSGDYSANLFYLGYCTAQSAPSAYSFESPDIPSTINIISDSDTYSFTLPSDGKNYYIAAGAVIQSASDSDPISGSAATATSTITINSITA